MVDTRNFIFFIFYEGLYDDNLPFWDETKDIAKSVSLASIALMAIVTLGKDGPTPIPSRIYSDYGFSSLFCLHSSRLWRKKICF